MICCQDTSRYGEAMHEQVHSGGNSRDGLKDGQGSVEVKMDESGSSAEAALAKLAAISGRVKHVPSGMIPKMERIEESCIMSYTWEYKEILDYIRKKHEQGQSFNTEVKKVQFRVVKSVFDGMWTFCMQKQLGGGLQFKAVNSKYSGPPLTTEFVVELRITHGQMIYTIGRQLSGKEIVTEDLLSLGASGVCRHKRSFNMEWLVNEAIIKFMNASARTNSADLTFKFSITARSVKTPDQ